jgi:hypothetical protein
MRCPQVLSSWGPRYVRFEIERVSTTLTAVVERGGSTLDFGLSGARCQRRNPHGLCSGVHQLQGNARLRDAAERRRQQWKLEHGRLS